MVTFERYLMVGNRGNSRFTNEGRRGKHRNDHQKGKEPSNAHGRGICAHQFMAFNRSIEVEFQQAVAQGTFQPMLGHASSWDRQHGV